MAKPTEELDELRVVDLRAKAKDAGVTGTSHMNKGELVDALSNEDSAQRGTVRHDTARKSDGAGANVIDLLIADHEKVRALFQQVLEKEPGDETAADLAEQIVNELRLHTEAEETLFYPALRQKAIDAQEDDAKSKVAEAYVEHGSVKELIAKLEATDPSDEDYAAILQVISEQVEHHVHEEESEMFDQARELFEKNELADLGRKLEDFKASAGTAP